MSYPQQQQQALPGGAVPLWAPYYGAPIGEAAKRFFKKYATFSGRASRSEYWWWTLISVGVSVVLQIVIASGTTTASGTITSIPGPGAFVGGILALVWGLAVIVPSLALMARRLHDVNMSAWMILIALVPFLGGLALLVIMVLPSNPHGQRFDRPEGSPAYAGTV